MKQKFLLFATALLCSVFSYGQGNVAINSTGEAPDNSAMLDVKSTNKGILIPRMTESQRVSIISPAVGLVVYQNDGISGFYYYNGTIWKLLDTGSNAYADSKVKDEITDGITSFAPSENAVFDALALKAATNQTFNLGTTSMALNRASAPLALTGITSIDGNAATATKLLTPRAINGVLFDGTSDISVTATPTAHTLDSHSNVLISANTAGEILKWDGTRWVNNTLTEAGIFDKNYSNLTNAPDIALSTTNKTIPLATGGLFQLYNGANTYLTVKQSTGLVGLGTNATDPRAQLEIGGTEGLLVRGTVNSGTIRALGAGLRMHWYPRKGAFRVGNAETSYWDDDGTANPKMSLYSIAMGYQPRASAVASSAMGAYNQATGDYSLSLGSYSQATQSHAVAIGTQAYATGIYSIAMGSGANTNGRDGSMVVGDDAYFQTAYSSADNQLTMRFIGGYRLWSSYPDSTAGVYMRHGQSGWSNYCNRNLKENFRTLDLEDLLRKVDKIPVTQWNYKTCDTVNYIGPMAQDFYAAFHLNGTDSLGINSIDIDGVNMAAIQGLIKRTDQLKSALSELQQQRLLIDAMKKELADLKSEVAKFASKSKEQSTEPQANVQH
jgi:hypothetical protein